MKQFFKSNNFLKKKIKKIKILFVSSELTPIAKVGGLGDVAGALPKALKKLGIDIRIVIPKYEIIDTKKYSCKLIASKIRVKDEFIDVYQTFIPQSKVPVYLLDNKKYLSLDGVYFEKSAFVSSFKEIERFLFLSLSSLEIFDKLNWWPDIIHCQDWHTAIVAALLKIKNQKSPPEVDQPWLEKIKNIKTLFTIHNLANQGKAPAKKIFNFLGLTKESYPSFKKIDKEGNLNLMEQGILSADLVNTVSPTYAQEILTKEYGEGLEKSFKMKKKSLHGILNGIDQERFNPEKDPEITQNYELRIMSKKEEIYPRDGKIKNKLFLQKICSLSQNVEIPVLSLVSRLTYQKGIDLIYKAASDIIKLGAQMVFLGVGSKKDEEMLLKLAIRYPKNVSTYIKFDPKLAQQIYAGADIFLMPSRFEPCGLGQMIAMRYGTVPIIRATGGLKDTVKKLKIKNLSRVKSRDEKSKIIEGTGFVFKNYNPKEFLEAVKRALKIYQNKKLWQKLQANAMKKDFSWTKSAKEYLKLYCQLLN